MPYGKITLQDFWRNFLEANAKSPCKPHMSNFSLGCKVIVIKGIDLFSFLWHISPTVKHTASIRRICLNGIINMLHPPLPLIVRCFKGWYASTTLSSIGCSSFISGTLPYDTLSTQYFLMGMQFQICKADNLTPSHCFAFEIYFWGDLKYEISPYTLSHPGMFLTEKIEVKSLPHQCY